MQLPLFRTGLAALVAVSFAGAALAEQDIKAVMTSIHIDPGQHARTVTDVNGSIHIGANAVVESVHDVNGSIHVDEGVTAQSLGTVNGSVHVGAGAHVAEDVRTVNGAISIDSGSQVGSVTAVNGSLTVTGSHVNGEVHNVNGGTRLLSSHIGGSVTSVNGGIEIGADTHVDGGLYVRRNNDSGSWFNWFGLFFSSRSPPRVVIGPGAVVSGPLVFEQDVKLYVSDRATIGPVKGATAIRFSGTRPEE
ncbi:MAG TPA: hypothetical protein VN750_03410 [Steroidobacteraceae bacterium]|nr:hypothetical protein [Steroidobacteraceae bacterium]